MVIKSFPRNGKISLTRDRKMNYFIYTSHQEIVCSEFPNCLSYTVNISYDKCSTTDRNTIV